ncbi:MAG: hypothetical protein JST43_01105 [Bacteroidetes bacterium]|nr:hypothetical protein [Bacteroidota bacterium]MBS1540644.1 hypothetical protein [Bacteroidota bacterium]
MLSGVFQEIPLYIITFVVAQHLPYQMEMVGHDHEPINNNALVFDQKTQAVGDDFFEPVFFEQSLPLQAGHGKKLRVLFGINHWER